MQKFIISVKTKNGQNVIPPYILSDLSGLGPYSESITSMGLVLLIDSLREENDYVQLPTPKDDGK